MGTLEDDLDFWYCSSQTVGQVSSLKSIENTYSLLSGQVEDQVGGDEGLGMVMQEDDILVLEAREIESGNLALESVGGAFGSFP